MKVNDKVLDLIKKHEGLELDAYLCPAKVWTIGYGNTFYENGIKVKEGDSITLQRADELFRNTIVKFSHSIKSQIVQPLNDNQFSALVSLAYNIGVNAFNSSTIRKKVNANPSDPTIRDEFARWNKSGGQVLNGLVSRRKAEADLYFS